MANSPLTKHDSWEDKIKGWVEVLWEQGEDGSAFQETSVKDFLKDWNDTFINFIKDLLQTQREELMEEQNRISNSGRKLYQIGQKELREELIQGLEKQRPGYYTWFRRWRQVPEVCKDDLNKLEDWIENIFNEGYTKAIDKVITLIKEGEVNEY